MGKAVVVRHAPGTPFSVSAAAGLLLMWGIVVLALLVAQVRPAADMPFEGPSELVFSSWIAYGALCIATAVWLSRLDRYALHGVAAFAILSFGKALADAKRGEFDAATLGLHVALPALALYAVLRHRRLLRSG